MDYATVKSLHELFEKRSKMRKAKGYASAPGFWENFLEHVGRGTGTHSFVVDVFGGRNPLAEAVKDAMERRFEAMENEIDEQIIDLGGKP